MKVTSAQRWESRLHESLKSSLSEVFALPDLHIRVVEDLAYDYCTIVRGRQNVPHIARHVGSQLPCLHTTTID